MISIEKIERIFPRRFMNKFDELIENFDQKKILNRIDPLQYLSFIAGALQKGQTFGASFRFIFKQTFFSGREHVKMD